MKYKFNTTRSPVPVIIIILGLGVICSLTAVNANAGWKDFVGDIKESVNKHSEGKLSAEEVAEGLKEALRVGSKKSIGVLGKENGFYKDKVVKIAMPKKLKKVDKFLRKIGQKNSPKNL